MTRKTLDVFVNETYSKPPKKLYTANKTDVYHIEILSLETLDSKDYGPEKNRRYKNVLVVIDKFSKFGW